MRHACFDICSAVGLDPANVSMMICSSVVGNILRHQLLKPGGAKDPVDLLEGVLGRNSLQHAGGGCMPHTGGLLHHYGIPTVA